jgi:hydrogenase expression/formation protein HypD
MKYVDEFRNPAKARTLIAEIRSLIPRIPSARHRPLQIMEACAGHTHAIFRYGIQQMLPDEVEFVHGDGCPVCVLPMGRVDDYVASPNARR